MSRSVFVAGTGTDVGKTYLSAILVKMMRDAGLNCGYYKPALSGAVPTGRGLCAGDADFVLGRAGIRRDPAEVVSYLFEEAVSPHLAAKRAGVTISPSQIRCDYDRLSKDYDFLTVEGCGGVLCPLGLDRGFLLADLIHSLGLGVVLVADAGLGTINAALLTVSELSRRRIPLRALLLNRYDPDSFLHRDNLETLEKLTGLSVHTCGRDSDVCDISLVKLLECYK